MPKYPINLDESSPECAPCQTSGPRKYYPTLHLSWKDKYELPEDGTLTVKFHKRRETNTESDDGDSQSVELEILSIESVKEDKNPEPKKSDRDLASEALDSYAEEASED
jgi:hypothetical protein